MDREGGEKAHPETIRVLPSPSVFLLHLSLHPTPFVSRRFSRRGGKGETEFHIITSRNDGERERERERERKRAALILVRCSPLSAATTFPSSSSNNSLLSTALFLSTAFEQWPWMRRGSRGKIVIRFFLLRRLLLLFPLCYCNSELLIFCDVLIVRFSWKI